MSWSERFVQDRKLRTDRAIHHASAQLVSDPPAFEKFHELLHCARKRAPRLFEAPTLNDRHPGVDALVHLSRFHTAHIRPATGWYGTSSSWRPAVSSLAHHLVCDYTVPKFLASSWHATDAAGDKRRGWLIAHSRGASFRSLDLPLAMTRKMEHLFLASHDHLLIDYAMRRAELLGLGMPAEFVKAILSTRLAADLRHGEFWRTVWIFLIANARDVDPAQIGPMIDYLQAVRHDPMRLETLDGIVNLAPPQPAFSMKGRTVQSMLRSMNGWHRSLRCGTAGFSWPRSPFQPWLFEEKSPDTAEAPKRWHMVELTDSAQLRQEGAALHHCVASYADRCYRGAASIWSLRFWQGERFHPVLTVEVDPGRRTVIQARGFANRTPSAKSRRLLEDWAIREKLRLSM